MSLVSKTLRLEYGQGCQVQIEMDMNVGIGGDNWPAAEMFCRIVSSDQWASFFKELFYKKNVLELGSGTGLVSIVLDRLCEPERLVVTDLFEYCPLIDKNIALNSARRCSSMPYDWTQRVDVGTFDIVLAFECIYKEELFEPLALSLSALSKPGAVIFLGFTRLFAKRSFFTILRRHGFLYRILPAQVLHGDNTYKHSETAIFILQKALFHLNSAEKL